MSAEVDAKNGDFVSDRHQKLKAVLVNQEAFMARAQIFGTPRFKTIPIGEEKIITSYRTYSRKIFIDGNNLAIGFQRIIDSLRADIERDQS